MSLLYQWTDADEYSAKLKLCFYSALYNVINIRPFDGCKGNKEKHTHIIKLVEGKQFRFLKTIRSRASRLALPGRRSRLMKVQRTNRITRRR